MVFIRTEVFSLGQRSFPQLWGDQPLLELEKSCDCDKVLRTGCFSTSFRRINPGFRDYISGVGFNQPYLISLIKNKEYGVISGVKLRLLVQLESDLDQGSIQAWILGSSSALNPEVSFKGSAGQTILSVQVINHKRILALIKGGGGKSGKRNRKITCGRYYKQRIRMWIKSHTTPAGMPFTEEPGHGNVHMIEKK